MRMLGSSQQSAGSASLSGHTGVLCVLMTTRGVLYMFWSKLYDVAGSLGWLRLTDHCSVNSLLLQLHRLTSSPTLCLALESASTCRVTASSSDSSIKRSSGSGASLKHAAIMVNDSKAVSCTVPVFVGIDWLTEYGLTSHQTHYRSSKHWRNTQN